MPLSQVDHFEAAIRRFQRARDDARERARELEETIAALERAKHMLSKEEQAGDLPITRPIRKRGYLREAILDWIREHEKPEFAASQMIDYLAARGFTSKYLLNNAYEVCLKMVERGTLEKIEGGFRKKGQDRG